MYPAQTTGEEGEGGERVAGSQNRNGLALFDAAASVRVSSPWCTGGRTRVGRHTGSLGRITCKLHVHR